MSKWQPIETAPEAGEILAFDGRERRVVRWGSLYLRTLRNGKAVDLYGWTVSGEPGKQFRATHWMHLPDPPKE